MSDNDPLAVEQPPLDAKPGDVWGAYQLNEYGWWVLNTREEEPNG